MSNPPEPDPSDPTARSTEVHPLAFTIQFHDRKVDENRQLKIHERLSAFALKHRRNPSLPDFKNAKSNSPTEKLPPNVPKPMHKSVSNSESLRKWEKEGEISVIKTSQSPIALRNLPNGMKDFSSSARQARRSSLNDIDSRKLSCQELPIKVEFKLVKKELERQDVNDSENKSDTVSEAGTYTVDKDENLPNKKIDKEDSSDELEVAKENSNFHHKWINDWVNKVAEQNLLHPVDPPPIISKGSGSENSSPARSKIPSPVNTLSRFKGRQLSEDKPFPRMNGNFHHRRSSSLSSKDYNEHRASDSSLETESFLRTTESVMAAMQNRMRLSLDGRNSDLRKSDRRDYTFKEKPHPPSTASDTDTNSESEGKIFKKPLGNPFTSARLNRAFSLRRAKAEPEGEQKKKDGEAKKRSTPSPNPVRKPPLTTPFSRTDCGRFSMRSTVSTPKFTTPQNTKKEAPKKPNSISNGRSNSSLSSREVEFQNWKRRKSFDPMKAAAEGRKKELAKKAAMNNNQAMTQSSNMGSAKSRSGNPVLRSASFHSAPQALVSDEEDQQEQTEESLSSWASNQPPRTSPTQSFPKSTFALRTTNFSSRSSVVSETHSSPSHRVRSEVLDNLVMTAINDLSYKLRFKSCNLLKKLLYVYEADEDRSFRLRDEIATLENRNASSTSSPIHQSASRDLSSILKNLKSMENVLRLLDDVLFDENLEVFVDN
ncbi:UNVERIFIED_CONTAM: hypothetical protein PYX00_006759 [Menopon gallinae]|uniref:Uncharacterized protein n=1 Tax=Menopon gallinae TaxID=328185 RepID=A0AAW2HX87_9NEOP